MEFPFDNSLISDHRFHGAIAGTLFLDENKKLFLATKWGVIGLIPFKTGDYQRKLFRDACKMANSVNRLRIVVYGYPKTDKHGLLTHMILINWHCEASHGKFKLSGLSHKFNVDQMFLCGRIRQVDESNQVAIKVKANQPNPHFRVCYINGKSLGPVVLHSKVLFMAWPNEKGELQMQPLKTITPPGQKTHKMPK